MTDSVLKILAGIALALTVMGLFSVLTYTVERRLPEFGVRLALGATRRHLAGLVIRRAVQLTLTGVALGFLGAFALARYIESLLFETTPYSAWVLGAIGLLVLATTTIASFLPVLRAVNVDVTKLLRSE